LTFPELQNLASGPGRGYEGKYAFSPMSAAWFRGYTKPLIIALHARSRSSVDFFQNKAFPSTVNNY